MRRLPKLLMATKKRVKGLYGNTLVLVVLMGLTVPPLAQGYFAGGGKDADRGNDCLIGYQNVNPDQVTLDGEKQVVVCTDCVHLSRARGLGVSSQRPARLHSPREAGRRTLHAVTAPGRALPTQ